ncbi:hypothetical protein P872_21265 [Rhodonellum psychrophilum GCM71 = DSM 17998]|uniref:DUF5777 domain-containing protein n=2 Tax=Rhodonellum TaxID=336827 RepID=U5BS60_9BACT|nr:MULTISPECIES: DUF5777 family beta-barrel protein [Rhodonellum]ERM80748.1 hypothetical protein P872_21265 [Rhodonellum psychrophilum GCM71 = DSM 17998]SDZ07950.1 hypothetical protein SAMN05444412_105204 [Rhodonellum ikkaensis]
MKKTNKSITLLGSLLLVTCCYFIIPEANAQEKTKAGKEKVEEPEDELQTISVHSRKLQRTGNTFESTWIIDNQTTLVPMKQTFQFDILHRFGTVNNGFDDLWGMYAPSNIRMGFSYTPINKLMVGFGLTKDRMLWDFNAKYAFISEDSKTPAPVSVTYFGNVALDSRPEGGFVHKSDRYSFFHQLMVSKKVTRDFSIQGSVNFSHFNAVEAFLGQEEQKIAKMKNDHFSFSVLGRYKVSDAFAFIGNYDQPITKHNLNNPNPNISLGVELATPLHAFQIFMGNYKWLVPQYNNVFNRNDPFDGRFLIGFNITRLMDLKYENLGEMMFKRKNKEKE